MSPAPLLHFPQAEASSHVQIDFPPTIQQLLFIEQINREEKAKKKKNLLSIRINLLVTTYTLSYLSKGGCEGFFITSTEKG